jgi:hypothetical protein
MKLRFRNTPPCLDKELLVEACNLYASRLMSKRLYQTLHINIKFEDILRTEKLEGECVWEDDNRRPKEYTIRLHTFKSARKILIALAHEFVHVKQFAKGELVDYMSKGIIAWKREKFNFSLTNYNDMPWEKEALENEMILYNLFKESRNGKGIQKKKSSC